MRPLSATLARARHTLERVDVGILLVLFGFGLLAIVWTVVLVQASNDRARSIEEERRDLANLTRAFEEHCVRSIRSVDQTLQHLKVRMESEGRAPDLGALERQEIFSIEILRQIVIADGTGKVVAAFPTEHAHNIADREHFVVQRDSPGAQPAISIPILGRSSGVWSLRITRRIEARDGSFAGVVSAGVEPRYFTDFYRQVHIGERGVIALVGLDGIVRVRRSGDVATPGQNLASSRLFGEIAKARQGTFLAPSSTIDGVHRLFSYSVMDDFPLVVVVGREVDEILAEAHARRIVYVWAGVMVSAFIVIAIAGLGGLAVRQRRAMKSLRASELHAKGLLEKVRRDEEQIRVLATRDALTGLHNRIMFAENLAAAIARARRSGEKVALLIIDLDRFKAINDTLGHVAGDELIGEVARRFVGALRSSDPIARLGGDEFTVIAERLAGPEDAVPVVESIMQSLVPPFRVGDQTDLCITASIGIAMFPDDADDAQALVRHGDTAMYGAKAQGRNAHRFFSASMETGGMEHLVLEQKLRRALEMGEISVAYQPKIALRHGGVVGFEALARWTSDSLGKVPPSRFIPLAEESGLILTIGEWVLRTACTQTKRWQEAGWSGLRIAVNVSARQFQSRDMAADVERILAETRLAPTDLEIEVTESSLLAPTEDTLKALTRLRTLGVRITIDDLGTGYSSLTYLRRLPVGSIKIDQSFVRDIGVDETGAAIIRAIIGLARNLRLRVTAEGVETPEQLQFLSENDCDEAQGYLVGVPMSVERVIDYLRGSASHEGRDAGSVNGNGR